MKNTRIERLLLASAVTVSIACVPLIAQTYVCGEVEGIWSLAGSPYILSCDAKVAANKTLIIEPGVAVSYYGGAGEVLHVYGKLSASNVSFTKNWTEIHVHAGGELDLTDCSNALTVILDGSSTANIQGGIYKLIEINGAGSFTISNLRLTYHMHLYQGSGQGLTISNVSFDSETPFTLWDPDIDTSGISGNVYVPDAYIGIRGVVDENKILAPIDGLTEYRLVGSVTVDGGITIAADATLTVKPGVEFANESAYSDIHVYGTLNASGAMFLGQNLDIFAYEKSRVDFMQCRCEGKIYWNDGCDGRFDQGFASIMNIEDPNSIKVFCSEIRYVNFMKTTAGCMMNNVFTDQAPYRVFDPDLDTDSICSNQYVAEDPFIYISGTRNDAGILGYIDGLGDYVLMGNMIVSGEAGITVPAGVSFTTSNLQHDIDIYGSLAAYDVNFMGNNTEIGVFENGSLDLIACNLAGTLTLASGSLVRLEECKPANLYVDGNTDIHAIKNDFSSARVTATGNPSVVIDLESNYWGTVDSTKIDTKITDHNDDPARPLINYSPFLMEPVIRVVPVPGDMNAIPDGKVDGEDLMILSEVWLKSCCSTGNWCGGSDLNRDGDVNFEDFAIFAGSWLIIVE
jgi:hypothetical protein